MQFWCTWNVTSWDVNTSQDAGERHCQDSYVLSRGCWLNLHLPLLLGRKASESEVTSHLHIVFEATFTLIVAERHRRQKMRCGLTSSCGPKRWLKVFRWRDGDHDRQNAGEVNSNVVPNFCFMTHDIIKNGIYPSSSRMFAACNMLNMITRKASASNLIRHISSADPCGSTGTWT